MNEGKSIFDQLRSLFGKSKGSKKPVDPASGISPTARAPDPIQGVVSAPNRPRTDEKSIGHAPPPSPEVDLSAPRVATTPPVRKIAESTHVPEVDLMIGIDFGTSCTKVVIGDHGWLGKSYAVPVGEDGNGLEQFLRPTQLRLKNSIETNLKMRLMAKPDSVEVKELVALYLAGVIRDSLRWFSEKGSRRYTDRTPVWSLNLGFPAKRIEDGPLVAAYKEIANLAARLGPSELPLTLTSIRSLRNDPETNPPRRVIPLGRIELYPEIAAQLAGYINSPYRAQGNLILVDVGAGTLDVSTAILHGNDEEDVVSFHFCDVGPFGAMKLLEARMAALEVVDPGSVQIRLADFQSGIKPIPESAASILGQRGRIAPKYSDAFDAASTEFADQSIRLAISCASRFRKLQRDANANPAFDPWPGQVRFFFTGGGSRLGFYRSHFAEGTFEQELSRFTRWRESQGDRRLHHQGLRLEPLPAPPELEGLPVGLAADFDRLSVAHGLAYGSENLMKLTASVHS